MLMYTRHGMFDPFNPVPAGLNIEDIAFSLSRIVRFNGHIPVTVAEHSVMVSRVCSKKNALAGLMHDAAEAYLGDVINPHKKMTYFKVGGAMYSFEDVEKNLLDVIFDWVGLRRGLPEDVRKTDARVCELEIKDRDQGLFWSSERSYDEFLKRYDSLRRRVL